MAYATADDVAVRLGRSLTDPESDQVSMLLDDVETLILVEIPDLDARLLTDSALASRVLLVEAQAVKRVMLNPGGYRQVARSVDDYSVSFTVDSSISGAGLSISDAEWALLGVGLGSTAGTVSLAGGYA